MKCLKISGLQKGPEKRCRAKIVEKCRKNSLTLFDDFWRVLPCAKIVEKCRKTFWHFLTIFDVFWRGPFPPAPFAIRWENNPPIKTTPFRRSQSRPIALRSSAVAMKSQHARGLAPRVASRTCSNEHGEGPPKWPGSPWATKLFPINSESRDFHFLLQDPQTLELILKPRDPFRESFRNPSETLLGSGGSVAWNESLDQKGPILQLFLLILGSERKPPKKNKYINQKLTEFLPGFSGDFCLCVFLHHEDWPKKHRNKFSPPTRSRDNPPNLFMFMCFSFPEMNSTEIKNCKVVGTVLYQFSGNST